MRSILVLAAAAMLSLGAHAQAPQSGQDHAAHHPDGGAASAVAGKKAPRKAPGKSKAAAPSASGASGAMGMGMGGDMPQMHDQMHKPGGMHDQMHGKDGQMMGGMPAASAASK